MLGSQLSASWEPAPGQMGRGVDCWSGGEVEEGANPMDPPLGNVVALERGGATASGLQQGTASQRYDANRCLT